MKDFYIFVIQTIEDFKLNRKNIELNVNVSNLESSNHIEQYLKTNFDAYDFEYKMSNELYSEPAYKDRPCFSMINLTYLRVSFDVILFKVPSDNIIRVAYYRTDYISKGLNDE